MNETISASSALSKETGGLTYDHRWSGNTNGKYILGFDYDKTDGTATTMRAVAAECKNKDPDGGRELDGNRVQPSKDNRDWSY